MAEPLHNVFLPVQFVAHTTAEWAGSTPHYPPTLRPMLMKSWLDRGVVFRQMEASEPQVCPAANGSCGAVCKSFPIFAKLVLNDSQADSDHSASPVSEYLITDKQQTSGFTLEKLCLWAFGAFQAKHGGISASPWEM